ncbi:RagB/SusD family nutrient uptake outer membrane protein [Saccharicrinis aurantiacus]|uniref:RagB/SusD family nutrient uptake outer membrane protein n=1 Tax=Saccharicrinis aurantiacus TaxID=1849719 RepID=UPI002491C1A4|nr:RagB/SusD family nutrient uptake outer membrane protein [Saccharicrinis aurantiacus]
MKKLNIYRLKNDKASTNTDRFALSYVLAFLFILSLSGCSDDFLNKNPQDKLNSGNFWKTKTDAELALAGCYSQFQAQCYANSNVTYWIYPIMLQGWEELTDNAYGSRDNGFRDLVIGNYNPNGDSKRVIKTLYPVSYNAINSCNLFLENIEQLVDVMSADEINQMKGEVMFLRAYAYYYLGACYGDVPIRVDATTIENQYTAKSTQIEVFEQCIKDIDMAIPMLSDKMYDGHVMRGAAQTLKAKVLLYMATDYAGAAAAAKSVIDSKHYSLVDDYSSLFVDGSQDNNPEIIYSIKMYNIEGESPGSKKSHQNVIARWGNLHPTQEFIDAFECTDGKPITESPLYDEANPTINRDPRMELIIQPQWFDEVEINPVFGFVFVKGISQTMFDNPQDIFNDGTDYVHLRYADVLLMYAEAMIEDNKGSDATVLEAINTVRARAYGVGITETDKYPSITTTATDELRDIVRYERRVELALENSRYFDLKRWGIAEQVLNGFEGDPVNNRVFEKRHYKWPLPQTALDNNPELVQNSDYN